MAKNAARTYADITKEIELLQKEAQDLRKKEVAEVVARINEAIAHYGLRPSDLKFGGQRPNVKAQVAGTAKKAPDKRKALDLNDPLEAITDKVERIKASIRAKVEHPFRVIKKQFGHVKVRYRGLEKNTAQLKTLFMLGNLWMVRGKLMAGAA